MLRLKPLSILISYIKTDKKSQQKHVEITTTCSFKKILWSKINRIVKFFILMIIESKFSQNLSKIILKSQ
jgi:hypothetical protein